MTLEMERISKLYTLLWNKSKDVVEIIQMQVGFLPHPHTQSHTQYWQIVSISSLSPMEAISTSPSSTWI